MTKIQLASTFIFVCFVDLVFAANTCEGDIKDAEMVANCFYRLYTKDYDKLWDFLNKENKRLTKHGDKKSISKFLFVVNAGGGNAEYREFLNEFIEDRITKKPKIFLDSLLLVDKKTLKNVFNILEQPLFETPERLIAVLEKHVNLNEYKSIRNNMVMTIENLK